MAVCGVCGKWYSREDDVYCCDPDNGVRAVETYEFNIKVTRDGASWCALIGPNLHEGIAALGPTPPTAVRNLLEELVQRREAMHSGDGPAVPWEEVVKSLRDNPVKILMSPVHGPYCSHYTKITDVNNLTRTVKVFCGKLSNHEGPCDFVRSM